MSTLSRTLVCLLASTSFVAAQQNILFHDDAAANTGVANAFPFGAEGTRTQQLIPGSVLGTTPVLIQDLFVAPAQTASIPWTTSEVAYADFEIRIGTTTATTLTTSWAGNLPNPTTVYRGPIRIPFTRDAWSPLGLPRPFVWAPTSTADNLVIDFIFWRAGDYGSVTPDVNGYFMWMHAGPTRTIQRAFLRRWTTSQPANAQAVDTYGIKLGFLLGDGNFVAHGGGCVGSSGQAPKIATPVGTWPQLGVATSIELQQGPPTSFAFLNVGASTQVFGSTPLPLDLAVLGAPGCFLFHDLHATFPATATDATGAASQPLTVPNSANLLGARVYASWFCGDPAANALGFTTSGYLTIILGT